MVILGSDSWGLHGDRSRLAVPRDVCVLSVLRGHLYHANDCDCGYGSDHGRDGYDSIFGSR